MPPQVLHIVSDFLGVPPSQPSAVPSEGGRRRTKRQAPSYRHGTPSGPWPWVDIDDKVDQERIADPDSHLPMSGAPCPHEILTKKGQTVCWCKYPQALFPNWTKNQQKKSKMYQKIKSRRKEHCYVYYVDVGDEGRFNSVGLPRKVDANKDSSLDEQWALMMDERPQGSKARVIFIDKVTGPIMQMMGTRYNIEPFFFTSTLNWIPSRFQSNIAADHSGDHVTLTLSFIRAQPLPPDVEITALDAPSPAASFISRDTHGTSRSRNGRAFTQDLEIDTQAPLPLRNGKYDLDKELVQDFISLHMVRSSESSTIISCHHRKETSTAEKMHERFLLTGKSVYWSSIFEKTQDATFLLLSILWYVMYAWDEVFEALYSHICFLESEVMEADNLHITRELHAIRAHLMHYESLLENFKKTVEFVRDTPHPALDNEEKVTPEIRDMTHFLIKRECENMLRDIERLEKGRVMQDKRLKNVMDLGFSLINIEDSRRMKKLTEAAVRDSAAMKQIAYLTMIFLPATLVAGAFGMNVVEINPEEAATGMTLAKYFAVSLPLTVVTIWIVVACQIQIEDPNAPITATSDSNAEPPSSEMDPNGEEDNGHIRMKQWEPQSWQSEIAQKIKARKYLKLGIFSRLLWPFFLAMSILERRKIMQKRSETVAQRSARGRIKWL